MGQSPNVKIGYPSCMCERIECDCCCMSGGLDRDGNVCPNICFDRQCEEHGKKCIKSFRSVK